MTASELRRIEDLLFAGCRRHLRALARKPAVREVYAFALDVIPHDGWVQLCLNTEAAHRRRARRCKPEDREGVGGVRFNPGDFAFSVPIRGGFERAIARVVGTLRSSGAAGRRFLSATVRVVKRLGPDLARLDRTEDFIAYASVWETDEDEKLALMRRTVTRKTLLRLFPEEFDGGAGPEAQAASLEAPRPPAAAVELSPAEWVQALVDHLRRRRSPVIERLEAAGSDGSAAARRVGQLGSEAVPALLDALDEVAFLPEFNPKGSAAFKEQGAFSREHTATASLLEALEEAEPADESTRKRVSDLLQRLHAGSRGRGPVGLSPFHAARTLARLWPDRYPEPELLGDNRIGNPQAFGLDAR